MGEKTAKEMAEKEVNKTLAKAIANRQLEIKKYQAKIKKLEKEIEKIESGELVPDDEDSSSSHFPNIIERREEHHHHYPTDRSPYDKYEPIKKYKPTYWTYNNKTYGMTTTNQK